MPPSRKRAAGPTNAAELAIQQQLECPVCMDIGEQIFQCTDGHVVCGDCHPRCQGKCPTCRGKLPVPGIRNRALEGLLPLVPRACCFKHNGCRQIFKNDEEGKRSHEKKCAHKDHECALCDLKMPLDKLYDHWLTHPVQEALSGRIHIFPSKSHPAVTTPNPAYFCYRQRAKIVLARLKFTSYTSVQNKELRYPEITCIGPLYTQIRCETLDEYFSTSWQGWTSKAFADYGSFSVGPFVEGLQMSFTDADPV